MESQEDKLREFKNLSHDIRNILSTIVNSASILKQNIDPATPAFKYANIIENNSQRASEIIHEFLSTRKTQKRIIDSSALFEDIALSFANTLQSQIIFNPSNDSLNSPIFGNYSDLYRVFLNLLVNANEAIAGKGIIDFEKRTINNKSVIFIVKDSGKGIPKENLNRIFESGFSTKNKGRESGMGLDIVKDIIDNHNGSVKVKSEIEVGTEFIVSIPMFTDKMSEGLNKKVLIADDDNNLRESLADLFDSYNYTTLQAKDGDEVIEFINNNPEIDLLIIDKKMPKKNGIRCISEIRAVNQKLPIVLVTGINLDVNEIQELETTKGANKIVLKPYDFIYLKEIVDSLIL